MCICGVGWNQQTQETPLGNCTVDDLVPARIRAAEHTFRNWFVLLLLSYYTLYYYLYYIIIFLPLDLIFNTVGRSWSDFAGYFLCGSRRPSHQISFSWLIWPTPHASGTL